MAGFIRSHVRDPLGSTNSPSMKSRVSYEGTTAHKGKDKRQAQALNMNMPQVWKAWEIRSCAGRYRTAMEQRGESARCPTRAPKRTRSNGIQSVQRCWYLHKRCISRKYEEVKGNRCKLQLAPSTHPLRRVVGPPRRLSNLLSEVTTRKQIEIRSSSFQK